ncbi:MAG: aldo/keto reductase [Calditrichaeota bacterium]|nr:aldo/keto reductase [Calditrichota bacterium]
MSIEKRTLGRTGLEVTFLGFGALEIGRDWGIGPEGPESKPDEEHAIRVLNRVLDLGINLIDTARAYHRSEERIGKGIAHRRQEFVLATKCGEHSAEPETYYDFSYEAVADSIRTSLRLLRTEQIDILQIHFGPNPRPVLDKGETLKAMREAQEQGWVRFLGASPPHEVLDACIESGAFDVLQVHYNLLDRESETLIRKAHDHGIGILVRSPFAGGYLTPRVSRLDPRQDPRARQVLQLCDRLNLSKDELPVLALAFLWRNPAVHSVLVGTKSIEHLEANVRALERLPEMAERLAELERES